MAIIIAGMLDEREDALRVIKDRIELRGHRTVLIDLSIGTGAIRPSLRADVSARDLVGAAGGSAHRLSEMLCRERDVLMSLVGEGLTRKVSEYLRAGELEGMIAIGGLTGTVLSLTAMKSLPFRVPKLLLSSVAATPAYARQFAEFFAFRDITVMHTVVDTVGMNPLVRTLAVNGANAIAGMVEARESPPEVRRPVAAITEFGFCEKGAHHIRAALSEHYETVSFHAQGLGDRAAIDFAGKRLFHAFIDLVPAGFSEYLLGGNRATGPDRLDGLTSIPIPYLVAPGGFDMIGCGPIGRKKEKDPLWLSRNLSGRKLFVQDAFRVQARTTPAEMEEIAEEAAKRLNRYRHKGLVKFLIPKKGFSSLGVKGAPLHDPASDEAFIHTLKACLDPGIRVFEVDSDINSPAFARAVAEALEEAARPLLFMNS